MHVFPAAQTLPSRPVRQWHEAGKEQSVRFSPLDRLRVPATTVVPHAVSNTIHPSAVYKSHQAGAFYINTTVVSRYTKPIGALGNCSVYPEGRYRRGSVTR